MQCDLHTSPSCFDKNVKIDTLWTFEGGPPSDFVRNSGIRLTPASLQPPAYGKTLLFPSVAHLRATVLLPTVKQNQIRASFVQKEESHLRDATTLWLFPFIHDLTEFIVIKAKFLMQMSIFSSNNVQSYMYSPFNTNNSRNLAEKKILGKFYTTIWKKDCRPRPDRCPTAPRPRPNRGPNVQGT